MLSCTYNFLGTLTYSEAIVMMESKIYEAVEQKKIFWWGVEHPLVYTKGVSFQEEHLLQKDLHIISARRGGSITVHNQGQLVFYTVAPLSLVGSLEGYLRNLEASIIETLWDYSILAFLNPPFSGVWTKKGKISFVGLGMKHGAIYHGISINLYNNLNEYSPIYSCGLTLPVTRLIDLKTIYDTSINNSENSLLEDFSLKLYHNILNRFIITSPQDFRSFVNKKQSIFLETHFSFRLGQLYFNERRYWEAHEAWELFWHQYDINNDYRIFLQGLIQCASACFKLTGESINLDGALSLFKKSLEKFNKVSYLLDKYLVTIEGKKSLYEYITYNVEMLTHNRNEFRYIPYLIKAKIDNFY